MRTRVKICGITRREDAITAIRHGADAIGLVFYPPSPRAVSVEQAAAITAGLPPFVTVTALFVNARQAEIRETLSRVPIDLLQFHGDETPTDCAGYERPWIKAVRMSDGLDLRKVKAEYSRANGLLLDAYHPKIRGGTGQTFDWARIPKDLAGEIILAGGLDSTNVTEAVRSVRPYAVDVSGGVEQAKGVKDAGKIKAFIEGVKRGDES